METTVSRTIGSGTPKVGTRWSGAQRECTEEMTARRGWGLTCPPLLLLLLLLAGPSLSEWTLQCNTCDCKVDISTDTCSPKNIQIVVEGKAACRLHRKLPRDYNKRSSRTAGVTGVTLHWPLGNSSQYQFFGIIPRRRLIAFPSKIILYSLL
jgi:hypothetical protein